MSKHKNEPWLHFCNCSEPATPNPDSDGVVRLGFDDYERARACVNACQGIPQEQLSKTPVGGILNGIAGLLSSNSELLAALEEGRRAIGEHFSPNDCYATGPVTGNEFRDLVQCPACSFIAMYDDVIAKVKGGAA